MRNFGKFLTTLLSYILVAAVAVGATLYMTQDVPVGDTKLEQLENLLLNNFIGEVDKTVMEDAAAKAMISSLGDRWSYYISAADYASYVEGKNNAYVGIGVTIAQVEAGYAVQAVTAGGPAEEAGVLVGDVLTAADGTSLAGLDVEEGKLLIQGKEGTSVELTLQRGEETLTLTVQRRTIKTPVATATMLEGQIGLVTIENFNANCASESIAAIESLVEQGAVALIFDVRNNGGGYANEMVKLLNYLLPEGDLFRTVNYKGEEHVDRSDADCLQMPMAVLVNENSYSAAEFFAVALFEYEWAKVVGTQTSGKGHYQVTYQLADGSAVGLSIGKYFTPSGVSLEGVGITPEIYVEVDDVTLAAIYYGTIDPMEDPQILAAMEALQN